MTNDTWSERAQLYVDSDAHRAGADLDLLVEWARGAETALDVATGGGHVARRLREAGIDVVSSDPAAGMKPDVICRAEDLPFATNSFDLVACRVAPHHFSDVARAVSEMARVSRDLVLIVDTVNMGEAVEQAEKLRDSLHVRNYSEEEWREFCAAAGLEIEELRVIPRESDLAVWLSRTACEGEQADRVVELLGERAAGGCLRLDLIAIKARHESALSR
jgi:SAM-dependent methyltransferase